jgi:hypothetical protein
VLEAQKRLESLDFPRRPEISARIYASEERTVDGGHFYILVLPCLADASEPSNPHAHLLVNVIAAMCLALQHRPNTQAAPFCRCKVKGGKRHHMTPPSRFSPGRSSARGTAPRALCAIWGQHESLPFADELDWRNVRSARRP